jgi:hypothetical protein
MDVKAGDEVAIETGYGYRAYEPATVERVTPTGRIVVRQKGYTSTQTFDANGRIIGGGRYERRALVVMTDLIREVIERRRIEMMLGSVKWGTQPIEKLRQIAAILEADA